MARITYKLVASEVKAAKPADKMYKLADGGGLYLRIEKSGTKTWYYGFRFDGKAGQVRLGDYPSVSLAQAREFHQEARALLAKGINPQVAKKEKEEERRQAELAKALTFGKLVDQWLEYLKFGGQAEDTLRNKRSAVRRHLSAWKNVPYADISFSSVRNLLDGLLKEKTWCIAHRIATMLGAISEWARAQGLTKEDRFSGVRKLVPRRPLNQAELHRPAVVTIEGFSNILRLIDRYATEGNLWIATAAYLRILPYLPLRKNELARMRWNWIDFEKGVAVIPREHCKDRRFRENDFVLPLPEQALTILKEIREKLQGGEYVFPSDRRENSISEGSITRALAVAGVRAAGQCAHGFRSSFAKILGEHCKDLNADEVVQLCLQHETKDRVAAAYARGVRLDEKRQLMQFWADMVDALREDRELPVWKGFTRNSV